MTYENVTLGALLSDPRISPVAAKAILNRNLAEEPVWEKTLSRIREEKLFNGDIGLGIERLYQAADTGEWHYPLYSEEECAGDPAREKADLVWFPSDKREACERPFILLVPGGGFVNVWNLTEGWPIAEQFNRCGYHVFVLTYQIDGNEKLLERNMQDFAKALQFIKKNEERFHVKGEKYITCGFSAGGYLVCLWNTGKGYPLYGLPRPEAVFPLYPVISLREGIRFEDVDKETAIRLYGCSMEEAVNSEYEIPDHVEGFPPCAIFLTADDDRVSPENSRMLAKALERSDIPCRLEIGPAGGHGFADGSGMCMAGWPQRAVRWYESL